MKPSFTVEARSCGLLLHPTSLPGPFGCGDVGREARQFVDFLAAAGQRWWQMLPVAPPGPGNAPYSARSAFAGSPWLISLEDLASRGWLSHKELRVESKFPEVRVDYPRMMRWRWQRLRLAFVSYRNSDRDYQSKLDAFTEARRHWLPDFALFIALHRKHRFKAWNTWPIGERTRQVGAMRSARTSLADDVEFEVFVQWVFDQQWLALREYAGNRGVGLIGDVPIFTAHDSADVWANPKLFELDAAGRPRLQSGVPPDSFAKNGQLWGHPLYRWPAHRATKYAWWVERFRATMLVRRRAD